MHHIFSEPTKISHGWARCQDHLGPKVRLCKKRANEITSVVPSPDIALPAEDGMQMKVEYMSFLVRAVSDLLNW